MADIKSAAGEGPEPQVPGRDQPAQELANLIAQSEAGAKGKGFWRRRRRKTSPEPATPAPVAEPAEPETSEPPKVAAESAESSGAESVPSARDDSGVDAKADEAGADGAVKTADASAEDAGGGADEPEADGGVTADDAEASSADGDEPAGGGSTEAGESSVEDTDTADDGAADAASADADDAAAGAQDATEVKDAGAKAAEAAEGEDTAAKDEDTAAEDVDTAAEDEDATAQDQDTVAEDEVEDERPRPTVGVVYEPDESPDGFPLEYGNIIVGLPKVADGSAIELDEARAYAEELAAVQSAGLEPIEDEVEPQTEASNEEAPADERAEDADEEAPAEADERAEDSDEAAQAGADGTEDTATADAEEHADVSDEAAPAEADVQAEDLDDAAPAEADVQAEVVDEAAPAEVDKQAEFSEDAASGEADEQGAAGTAEESAADEAGAGTAVVGETSAGDESAAEVVEPAAEDVAAEVEQSTEDAETSDATAETVESADAAAPVADEATVEAEVAAVAEGEQSPDAEKPAPKAANKRAKQKPNREAEAAGGESAEEAAGDGEQVPGDATSAGEPVAVDERTEQDAEGNSNGLAAADASEVDAVADGEQVSDDADTASAEDAGEAAESGAAGPEAEGDSDEAAADAAEAQAVVADGGADAASGEEPEASDVAQDAEGDSEEAAEESAEVEVSAEELAERLAAEQAAMALITSLMKLRGALAGSRLPLDVVGADEARQQQKAMLDQLDDYILPRLVQLEAPILAVVGGSTGAGKSTLVNSVIGKVVSEPGVLRPTTRSPVLIHHPADADWFIGDRVLPGMARTTAESPGGMEDPGQLRLVASDTVPRGLAVLDAPDIDSVVEANRDLATQLLAAADLWLFVTTAARYSDAVPWEFLQSASDRSTAVAVVLDRAPAETIDDITGHLAQMLLERGLGDSPLFSIKETVVDGNGMLPAETVASIKDWLVDLAADAEGRAAVVRRTLHGAVTSMVKTTPPFAAAVRAQGDTAIELRTSVEAAYEQAVKDIKTATQDATLLRGEVLARWQEFVGTGELLKGLQGNSGKLRDKVKKSVGTAAMPTRDLNDAIESGLSSLLVEQAEAAAERAEKIWQATPAGRQLLAARTPADPTAESDADAEIDLGSMSPQFKANAERAVREWQAGVLDLVRTVGTEKRLAARILDAGVNGLSLSVMVVLFAENAGIPTGAEMSIGVGSAVVGQKLLTAVFGDAAVQTLVSKSREDLDGKVHALMDAEFARYLAVLDQHPVDPEAARQLTEAARAVEDCT